MKVSGEKSLVIRFDMEYNADLTQDPWRPSFGKGTESESCSIDGEFSTDSDLDVVCESTKRKRYRPSPHQTKKTCQVSMHGGLQLWLLCK